MYYVQGMFRWYLLGLGAQDQGRGRGEREREARDGIGSEGVREEERLIIELPVHASNLMDDG